MVTWISKCRNTASVVKVLLPTTAMMMISLADVPRSQLLRHYRRQTNQQKLWRKKPSREFQQNKTSLKLMFVLLQKCFKFVQYQDLCAEKVIFVGCWVSVIVIQAFSIIGSKEVSVCGCGWVWVCRCKSVLPSYFVTIRTTVSIEWRINYWSKPLSDPLRRVKQWKIGSGRPKRSIGNMIYG